MRLDHPAVLLRSRSFSSSVFSVTFSSPLLARSVAAGQFVMLEIPERIRPFLRRAYSVADADAGAGEVEFLVKTIGPGTAALEGVGAGEKLRLLGPLGNAFSLAGLGRDTRVAVVAGGIGAAPFPLLYRALLAAGVAGDFFLGGRTHDDLEVVRRFEPIVNGDTHLATDDGSRGARGYVTDLFARAAERTSYARVFACGPMPMFAALAEIVTRLRLSAQFSTEAAMGCGFGACLACVIPGTRQPFIVSCQEGPILEPGDIRWQVAGDR